MKPADGMYHTAMLQRNPLPWKLARAAPDSVARPRKSIVADLGTLQPIMQPILVRHCADLPARPHVARDVLNCGIPQEPAGFGAH